MVLRLFLIVALLTAATSARSGETYSCDLIKLGSAESEVYEILKSKNIKYRYYTENTTTTLAREFVGFIAYSKKNLIGFETSIVMNVGFSDGYVVHVTCNIIYTFL